MEETNDICARNEEERNRNSNISAYVIPLPPKYHQYEIGNIGNILLHEKRRLLTKINILEFSKWEQQTSQSITSWVDVFAFSGFDLVVRVSQ